MGLLSVWHGNYVTARCARDYIDAEGIISDANGLKGQLNEIDNLLRSFNNSASELTKDVLLIDDKDMSGSVEYTAQFIADTKMSQFDFLDAIIQRATALYNEKQEEFNRIAQLEDRRIAEQKSRKD